MSRSHRSSLVMPLSTHRPSGRIRITSQTRETLQTFLRWLKSQDRPKTLIILNYVAAFTLWLLFIIGERTLV
jgi:ACT domain-containing protein